MQITVGAVVEGRVSGITKFGAFIDLGEGKVGLVHISEVSQSFVKDVNDHLKENEQVKAKVISIGDDGKISLSIKQLMAEVPRERRQPLRSGGNNKIDSNAQWESRRSDGGSFEDMMNKFKQDSEDKISTLKRNFETRKSTGYRKGSK